MVKPFVTASVELHLAGPMSSPRFFESRPDFDGGSCEAAYIAMSIRYAMPYMPNPTGYRSRYTAVPPPGYPGFDPVSAIRQRPTSMTDAGPAPNNGAGLRQEFGGNKLPNAPPFTVSFGAQYTMPLTPDWAGTLRGDYYWQDYSWARVFNDNPYDRLRGYTNVNLTLIFTNQNGWQVMLYDKNVFNTTAITGDFLNSDDTRPDDQRVPDRSASDRHPRHEELVGGSDERIDECSRAAAGTITGSFWQRFPRLRCLARLSRRCEPAAADDDSDHPTGLDRTRRAARTQWTAARRNSRHPSLATPRSHSNRIHRR